MKALLREVAFKDLQPGYILGKPIEDENGRILLRAGTILTRRHLELIRDWGLERIAVQREAVIDADEVAETEVPKTHVLDRVLQREMLSAIGEVFASAAEDKHLSLDGVFKYAPALVEEVTTHETVTLDLIGLRRVDNYTFMHSLSVGVLAVAAGLELGMRDSELLDLSLSAVLHDVGKMKVPLDILNKPGKLDSVEWRLMKRHPRFGMEILGQRGGFSTDVLQGVYQHHERCDSSGYPHNLGRHSIGTFGKIIAIADFYDAMTSDRVYRPAVKPHLVVEQLIAESLSSFEESTAHAFIRSLAVYPVGSEVVMENGEEGQVVWFDRSMPNRPTVLILKDADGKPIEKPVECDLMRELTRFISEVKSVR